jgi:hypothetical protein
MKKTRSTWMLAWTLTTELYPIAQLIYFHPMPNLSPMNLLVLVAIPHIIGDLRLRIGLFLTRISCSCPRLLNPLSNYTR